MKGKNVMREDMKTKDAKKVAVDAIKSMNEKSKFVVITCKEDGESMDVLSHCDDMFIAKFIHNTLSDDEAMQHLCEYLKLKQQQEDGDFGDFLEALAGRMHEDDDNE